MSLSFSQDNPCQAPSVAYARTAQDILSMAATLTPYEHLFGPRHPQTLTVMGHLGLALWRAGDAQRGRMLLERAAHGLSQRLERTHPARVSALSAFGELLFAQGDFTGACLLHQEVLACRMETAGPGHPDTVAAERNLAATLSELGRWTPATSSLRQT
jgi:hypothetical protein